MENKQTHSLDEPDVVVDTKSLFNIDVDFEVKDFQKDLITYLKLIQLIFLTKIPHKQSLQAFQEIDVYDQGYHGTGKSTHIEQVAARLNWPCIRINLDSHISRIDLIGKDAIVIKNGTQVTEFKEGILPWAVQTQWP